MTTPDDIDPATRQAIDDAIHSCPPDASLVDAVLATLRKLGWGKLPTGDYAAQRGADGFRHGYDAGRDDAGEADRRIAALEQEARDHAAAIGAAEVRIAALEARPVYVPLAPIPLYDVYKFTCTPSTATNPGPGAISRVGPIDPNNPPPQRVP